ncbi:MAG: asparagine synthase (glutamine-hydrolyzing) [bacterium]
MCGIAGIAGPDAASKRDAVVRMLNAMGHRGPDGEGIHSSPSGACVLGHRRLSILDLSPLAAQPILHGHSSKAMVYNGECYNYRELRAELQSRGETFRSSGDAEVMLRLFALDGIKVLPGLNAMFALGIWDESRRELLLARDRCGQKPLYYARAGACLVFASEVRALLASGLVSRTLDYDGMLSFLAYGAVQGPGTIVRGVSLLAPATWMIFNAHGQIKSEPYWSPPHEKKRVTPEEFREEFGQAVERHLVSDVPIGMFLSGGIDSSAVAVAARRRSTGVVKTLSVVFPDQPAQSEAAHARRVADFAGTEHHEIAITGAEMLKLLPQALDSMDQPTSDGINTYLVSYGARAAGLTVALSGLGGDELFAGYDVFDHVPKMRALHRLAGFLRKPARSVLRASCSPFDKTAGKWSDLFASPGDLTSVYLTRRKLFSSDELRRVAPGLAGNGWVRGMSPDTLRDLEGLVEKRPVPDALGLLEMSSYMGQTLLRDSDVMSMAHGLEIRTPFLDAEFSTLALMADPGVRMRRATPKWYFVKAMGDWLPPENVHRVKQGFTLPFREWMQKDLRAEVTDGLDALSRHGAIFNANGLKELWSRFEAEPDRVRWLRPWSLFVLARYLRRMELT